MILVVSEPGELTVSVSSMLFEASCAFFVILWMEIPTHIL